MENVEKSLEKTGKYIYIYILKCAAFSLILALLLQGLGPIFQPKDNTKAAGFRYEMGIGYLAEPENTIDVVFIGDSRAYAGFIPLQIWEQYGISSVVCSKPMQYLYEAYDTLADFLDCQNPKMVVLETNQIYRTCSGVSLLSYEAEKALPFIQYHNRWKSLTLEDLTSPVNYKTIQRDKGYVYETLIQGAEPNDNMAPTDQAAPVAFLNEVYLRKLVQLCRDREIPLVFVNVPSRVNWYMVRHNGVARLAEEFQVPYMDLNLVEEISLDWTRDCYDYGDHMNWWGARKVTDYMGAYLWETGLFTDKRQDPAYADWNDQLEAFQAVLEAR